MRLDLTLVQEVPNVSNVNLVPTQCPTQVSVETVWLVTNVTQQLRKCVKKGSTRPVKVPPATPVCQEPSAVHPVLILVQIVLQVTSALQLLKQPAKWAHILRELVTVWYVLTVLILILMALILVKSANPAVSVRMVL